MGPTLIITLLELDFKFCIEFRIEKTDRVLKGFEKGREGKRVDLALP